MSSLISKMKLVANRKWKVASEDQAKQIKDWLIENGGKEDVKITNAAEVWRIRYSDATLTLYKSNTLFITDSEDEAVVEVHNYITSLIGSKFIKASKKYLIGFDETGKGEGLGHTVLVGVLFPAELYDELEQHIGVADTKVKHEVAYWDDVFRKIDFYRAKGMHFLIEKIPPWEIDKYNINKCMDIAYQRLLLSLIRGVGARDARVVLDDYGIGFNLNRYLSSIKNAGAEVVKTSKADDIYLESRVASLIAKREQQKVIEAIARNPEFQIPGAPIGSGNAGDPQTIKWLEEWKKTAKPWPWFVKRSFKNIRKLDGISQEPKKLAPPINERLLSDEFRKKFESGELSIESLSVVCPCGTVSKAIKLIPKEGKTTAICIKCQSEIPNISLVLRYYCGRILPDSSVIARGFISKDLEGRRLLENFTFLLHPVVREESDKHTGGKKEIERLGKFSAMGRIRLEEIGLLSETVGKENILKDESIMKGALENDAILMTADNNMKGSAQAKGLFVVEV